MLLRRSISLRPFLARRFSTSSADKDIESILNKMERTTPSSHYFADFSLFGSTPVRRCVITNRLLPECMLLRFTCNHTLSGMSFLQHDVSHHGPLPAAYIYASKSALYHPSLGRFIDASRLFGSPSPHIKSQFRDSIVQDVYNECLRLLSESMKATPNAIHINPSPKDMNDDLQGFIQSQSHWNAGSRPRRHKYIILLKQKQSDPLSACVADETCRKTDLITWFQFNRLPLLPSDVKQDEKVTMNKAIIPALPLQFPPDSKWYKGPLAVWRWGQIEDSFVKSVLNEQIEARDQRVNLSNKLSLSSTKSNSKNSQIEIRKEKTQSAGSEVEDLSPDVARFIQTSSLPIHFSESYRNYMLRNQDDGEGEDADSLRHSSLASLSQFEGVPIVHALEPLLSSAHVKATLKGSIAMTDNLTHLTLDPTPINNRLMSFLFKLRSLTLG